jgi:serine/threonine protein kinase
MPAAGSLVGHYRLRDKIGEGGMGEVYLADREGEFQKRVAGKLIRGTAHADTVRRFLIERQALAALNHPQIVRLIDGGATEDGLPYLVVDYVEGVPIDQYCDEHKLSVAARLRLFNEVCSAVQYAHQSLIVHCDLKPSNILVTADGVPMLLDFGIAKLLDPGSMGISETAAKTRQRAFTPSYASPEQLLGQPVTTATDVYALGVICSNCSPATVRTRRRSPQLRPNGSNRSARATPSGPAPWCIAACSSIRMARRTR